MKEIISKELLGEVLGVNVIRILTTKEDMYCLENEIDINYTNISIDIQQRYINIYELAHKCKEWAIKKYYSIESSIELYVSIDDAPKKYFFTSKIHQGGYREIMEFHEDTEPEAIFKACQWILDNKGSI